MPLTLKPTYIKEPNDLQCGQAVLAMLADKTVDEIISLVGTDRETDLKQMFFALEHYGIRFDRQRKQAFSKADLPRACVLSLETPRCWHWSLYFDGVFYDPEHGVLEDFPVSNRKFYWQIF